MFTELLRGWGDELSQALLHRHKLISQSYTQEVGTETTPPNYTAQETMQQPGVQQPNMQPMMRKPYGTG